MRRPTLILAAALLLAGCIRLAEKPPPMLLSLHSDARIEPGVVRSSAEAGTIVIAIPVTPREIAVARVPVHTRDTSVAYVKDAVWIEPPARQFARLLGDAVSARTGRLVISRRQSLSAPGPELSGELRSFGIDEAAGEAIVVFEATLVRVVPGPIQKRRFEARAPLAPIDARTVGPALNRAANQVAGEVAAWVGR